MFRLFRNSAYVVLLTMSFLIFSGGCASDKSSPTPECTTNCDTGDAAALFAWPSVPTFDITLPQDRWEYLQAHALEEKYEPASVSFEGKSVGTVGLRFKGSFGTLIPCIDAQGKLICKKLCMKLKFDEVDNNLRFYGLKRLNFHSMINDDTKIHERLAYDLFRDMGIVAPRSTWANVTVNGTSYGLFAMVEQVDGRFTEDRWPEDPDGDLYKEAWPTYSTELSYYISHLETDTTKASPDTFVKFASALKQAGSNQLGTELAKWMDTDYLARYMAVDEAIFNADGITAYYVSDDIAWAGNHNSYFYKEKKRDFFWLVPWDLEDTFIIWPSFSRVPRWDVVPADCSKLYVLDVNGGELLAPGCDRVFQAIAANKQAYKTAIDTLLNGSFAQGIMLEKIDKFSAFIAKAIEQEPSDKGIGVDAWKIALSELKKNVPVLRQRLQRLRDGQPVVPFDFDFETAGGFEEANDFGLLIGTLLFSNDASTVSRSITRVDPLVGAQTLRLDFEFRDEAKAWDQWLDFIIPLASGSIDVSNMAGIRFRAKSDRERTLRVEITGAENGDPTSARRGWDVDVGTDASTLEVRFDKAADTDFLKSVTGIAFQPHVDCSGCVEGFLGAGNTDKGFLDIDEIVLFSE
jgi:spore coat protein H